jgi:nucleoside-diphosphate-sugar epimerase
MCPQADLNVVLGAGGAIGGAVVRELAARELRVRAVGRRPLTDLPNRVEALSADLTTEAGARAAVHRAAVVYHCAAPRYTRWAEEFPALNDSIAAATAAAGAKLVFADNLYMYGPVEGPISASGSRSPTSRKGAVRKQLADSLLARHAAGSLRVAIGRASDYYGPGGHNSIAGDVLFDAALAGKSYRYPATLDVPHTFHYLPDIAHGLVALGIDENADGRAWILPAAQPLTGRELAELVYTAAAAKRVRVAALPRPLARLVGLAIPEVREMLDIWSQFSRPFTVDTQDFERELGPLPPTPHETAIAATVAWFEDQRRLAPPSNRRATRGSPKGA